TVIAILACLYASYSDMKEGVISNKLTFPLIGLGLLLNSVFSILTGFYIFIIYGVIFTAFIFGLGYLFWRLGAWAGGDVKLFTALAALLPFQPFIVNYTLAGFNLPLLATYPFPLTVIVNSILSSLPFLLLFVFYIGYREKPQVLQELISPFKDYKATLLRTLIITSAATLSLLLLPFIPFQFILLSLFIILVLVMVISKLPDYIKATVIILTMAYALYDNWELTLTGIIILFLLLTLIGIIKKLLTSVNKEALQDDLKIKDLKEGMISAYNLYQKEGEYYFDEEGVFSKIKSSAIKGDLTGMSMPKGKLIIGTLAAGLTRENLQLLKNLRDEEKIDDSFRVKRGVPFAPAILIGLLISLILGDLAFIVLRLIQSFT
ncbi:MAG: prepilin peptidase, partial [Euryarchaeota archaeon]|nr:prepilin peptidase [Euryarchaeota archaeon]